MTHGPLHSSWFDRLYSIWWGVGKAVLAEFSLVTCYLALLGPNIFLSTLFLKTLRLCSSFSVTPSFTPVQNNSNTTVLCILIFISLNSILEGKSLCTNDLSFHFLILFLLISVCTQFLHHLFLVIFWLTSLGIIIKNLTHPSFPSHLLTWPI